MKFKQFREADNINIIEDYYKFRKWKEMFYLMMHSMHFYLWLYGIEHIVKKHLDINKTQ